MSNSALTHNLEERHHRQRLLFSMMIYAIIICDACIALPKSGITYVFQRLLQLIIVLCFIFFNLQLLKRDHTLRLDSVQCLIHLWWIVMIVLTVTMAKQIKLSGIYQWISICVFLLMIMLYWQENLAEQLHILALVFAAFVYMNGILYVLYPDGLWIEYDWQGTGDKTRYLFGNYNQTGIVILTAVLVNGLDCLLSKRRMLNMYMLMLVGVATVFAMGSMTSTVGLVIVSLYFIFRRFVKHPIPIVNIFIVLYILFFAVIVWGGKSIDSVPLLRAFVEGGLQKDSTFTSRVGLWLRSIIMIMDKPILGYGPQDTAWMMAHIGGSGPHNMWLMFMLEGGVFLTSIFALLIIKLFRFVRKNITPIGIFSLVCVCVLLLMSLFETYHIVCVFILIIVAYYTNNITVSTGSQLIIDERDN